MRLLPAWIAGVFLLLTDIASGAPAAGFSEWLKAEPGRQDDVRAFELYLQNAGVGRVLPADELLRNATSWKSCKLDWPYSMPPRALWPHIVATLKFLRDDVIPLVGPVRVESGYREPKLNRCAGGAPMSAHAQFYALDLVPDGPVTHRTLITDLCRLHRERGRDRDVGLGFYGGVRFHIDTKRWRLWGSDNHSGSSPCLKARRPNR
jgi:hypothetical protein